MLSFRGILNFFSELNFVSLPDSVLSLSIAAKGHLCPSTNTSLFSCSWRGAWIPCKLSVSSSLVHTGADDPRVPRPQALQSHGSIATAYPCSSHALRIPLPSGLVGWPASFLLETSVGGPQEQVSRVKTRKTYAKGAWGLQGTYWQLSARVRSLVSRGSWKPWEQKQFR